MSSDVEEIAEAPAYDAEKLTADGKRWMDRIRAAQKREEIWAKEAGEAETAYLVSRDEKNSGRVYQFNILHSNIETMVPAVFNSTPVPDIRERFRDGSTTPETSAAQQVSQIIERAIMVQTDDGALEREMELLAQSALLPGRGVLRVRFDADQGEMGVTGERLEFEAVAWRDYVEGPAKRWRDVPWVAFAHLLPWEQVQEIEDPEIKAALMAGGTDPTDVPDGDVDTRIWEIWCKKTRKVYMVVEESGQILSQVDDPLGLDGFFPCPEPVIAITVAGRRVPTCPFTVYQALAKELDNLSRRIEKITDGLRVRGLVAGDVGDLSALAGAGDNELIPIANLEGAAATGGISKAIEWWPVDKAIQVLRELYLARDQAKNSIYEITGISDIVRGQTNASETATAQQIKSQWGSIRIRRIQRQIERAARDTFVIMAELIVSKFSPETLMQITGVPITPEMMPLLGKLDGYRIDVESDSTVRADLSARKGEMSEFLQGTAAFFGTMGPMLAEKPDMAPMVTEIYAAFARQFNLGKQAEDALEAMSQTAKQPQPEMEQPDPAQMQMQAEMQAKQAEMQLAQQANQVDQQMKQTELQLKQAEGQAKIQLEAQKLKLEERKLDIEEQRLQLDAQVKAAEIQGRNADRQATKEGAMTAAGMPPDYSFADDRAQFAAIMERMGASDQAMAQMMTVIGDNQQAMAQMVAALGASITAPKQVVRDERGSVIGVRTVVN